MQIIVLAGGKGTRLKSVVNDMPKPMADINGKPFLQLLLDKIINQGVADKIILATGYLTEKIEEYFGKSYRNVPICYSVETEPLGTGGAIKKALTLCDEERALVLNGDTVFDIDYKLLNAFHELIGADITLASKKFDEPYRYGTLGSVGGRVNAFYEKKEVENGIINGGVYIIKKELLDKMPAKFSFEKDFLEDGKNTVKIFHKNFDGYFIDIGIPEDYNRAKEEL